MDLDAMSEALKLAVELIKWIMVAASFIALLWCASTGRIVGAIVAAIALAILVLKVVL